jgi:hypothetical protein
VASEGFAQFSTDLYLHRTAREKKFQTFLGADREFILNPLAGSPERARDAGPIWLGYRLNTEKSAGASRLIYAKGGLVLHMLRMLLYDYTRGDDSRFIAMMKEFVQTNAGKGLLPPISKQSATSSLASTWAGSLSNGYTARTYPRSPTVTTSKTKRKVPCCRLM